MLISRRTRRNIILFFLTAVLINLIDMFSPIDFPFHSIEILGWGMLMICWGSGVWLRVTDKRIRSLLLKIMMCFLMLYLFQLFKYQFLYDAEILSRHFWYAYYMPLIFIPAYSMMVSRSIGRKKNGYDYKDKLLLMAASLLVAFTMTNDLHQCVWRFLPDFKDWDSISMRGVGFYLLSVWIIILMLISLILAIKRGVFGESKRYMWIPFLVLALTVAYAVTDMYTDMLMIGGRHFFRFQQLYSLAVIVFWESFIQTGVIASNRELDEIFKRSGINAYVADKAAGKPAETGDENGIRQHVQEVTGGYVCWKDDVSGLRRLKEELSRVQESLTEEAEILRSQKSYKEKELSIKTRTEIYDRLSIALQDKTGMMERLTQAEMPPDEKLKLMAVIGAYIKRYGNLFLMAENDAENEVYIPLAELKLSMEESLRYAEYACKDVDLNDLKDCLNGREDKLPAAEILRLYSSFESKLEARLHIPYSVILSEAEDLPAGGIECPS